MFKMHSDAPAVLVVEDQILIAMAHQSLLEQCGCSVVGPVGSVRDALAIIPESQIEAALLDINLGKERVWPIARVLQERGIPFVLASGYNEAEIPAGFRRAPALSKPLSQQVLEQALTEIGVIEA